VDARTSSLTLASALHRRSATVALRAPARKRFVDRDVLSPRRSRGPTMSSHHGHRLSHSGPDDVDTAFMATTRPPQDRSGIRNEHDLKSGVSRRRWIRARGDRSTGSGCFNGTVSHVASVIRAERVPAPSSPDCCATSLGRRASWSLKAASGQRPTPSTYRTRRR
jgi:hypothetical protein